MHFLTQSFLHSNPGISCALIWKWKYYNHCFLKRSSQTAMQLWIWILSSYISTKRIAPNKQRLVCNIHTRLFLTLDWVSWLEVSWPCAIILQMRNFVALSYRYDQFAALRAIKFFSWLRLTILKKPRQNFLFCHWNPSKNLAFWNVETAAWKVSLVDYGHLTER